ncbi:MAG: DUF4339 domain-containing protein [bacterium]
MARLKEGERVWYCRIGGQIIGPVTSTDIRDAFSKGQIDGQATVGIQGKKDWFPIRSLPQFKDMITGIGRPPQARTLPVPVMGGASLPGPRADRRTPGPVNLPQSSSSPPPVPPSIPVSAPGPMFLPAGLPAPAPLGQQRNDETQVVPPLPPPTALPSAQSLNPGSPGANNAALLDELGRVRRMALLFGILSGVLMIASAVLLGLLVSR